MFLLTANETATRIASLIRGIILIILEIPRLKESPSDARYYVENA
jgi:hypothetical protein